MPLAAGYFLSYLFRNVNSVVASDIMLDLGIGADTFGLLTSVYFLTFAAAQLPVGALLDRYGPCRVQSALLLCAAAGAGLCALNGGFAVLLVGRALIGLGTAGGLVAGLKASAQWFPRERLAMANGAFIMCGGLGALAATWPVEFILRQMNWRGLSAVLAVAACIVAIAIRAIVPSQRPRQLLAAQEVRLRDVISDPMFRRFAPLSASCFGSVLAIQGLWVGPWLADVNGLSRSEIASDLACMAIVLIVAAPCWGFLTQRLRKRMRLTRVAAFAAFALIAIEALILAPIYLPPILPWSLFAVFGGMTVLSYSVLAEHFPSAAIGRANGALNMLHIGCSFVVQLGVGQVIALWPPAAGRYPLQAYEAGLMLPFALQVAALLWFAWPRHASQPALLNAHTAAPEAGTLNVCGQARAQASASGPGAQDKLAGNACRHGKTAHEDYRTMMGPTRFSDDRRRQNNRALRARRGLSASDRQELLRTAVAAVVGLLLIAIAVVAAGAVMLPATVGRPLAVDEAGAPSR